MRIIITILFLFSVAFAQTPLHLRPNAGKVKFRTPVTGTDLTGFTALSAVPLPGGVSAPGDAFTYSGTLSSQPASTPDIAEYNRQAGNSEHIVASYYAASPITAAYFYNGSTLATGTVSNVSSDAATIRTPASFGDGFGFMWPVNANGKGNPVPVNKTEVKWQLEKVSAGQTAYVFGRNLSYKRGKIQSYVYLKNVTTSVITQCTVTSVTPYRVSYTVPSISTGTYELWVHNGTGGAYGWSKSPSTVAVVDPNSNILARTSWGSIVNVGAASGTAATNVSNISTAVTTAGTTYNTIQFSSGTYTVNAVLPVKSNSFWKGGTDGSGNPATTIQLTAAVSNAGEGLLDRTSALDMVRFENIVFDANGNSTAAEAFIMLATSTNILFKNCKILSNGFRSLDYRNGNNIFLQNTDATGGGSEFDCIVYTEGLTQFIVDGGTYSQTKDCTGAFMNKRMREVAVMNTTHKDYNIASTDGSGTGKGRIWSGASNDGSNWDQHFENNTGIDLGVRRTGTNLPDVNSGEVILTEAGEQQGRFTVSSATATTVTFATTVGDASWNGNYHIAVVSGKGVRQKGRVISGGGTNTLTVRWLNTDDGTCRVTPNNTSVVAIVGGLDNQVVYNNTIDGKWERVTDAINDKTATAAVELYGDCFDNIVDGNAFNQMRISVAIYSTQHSSGSNEFNYYNVVKYNTNDSGRYVHKLDASTDPLNGDHPSPAIDATVIEKNVITNTYTQSISSTNYKANFALAIPCQNGACKTYTFAVIDNTVIANNTVDTNDDTLNWWGTDNGQLCPGWPCPPASTFPANSVQRLTKYNNVAP